jgi:hypothetical protein
MLKTTSAGITSPFYNRHDDQHYFDRLSRLRSLKKNYFGESTNDHQTERTTHELMQFIMALMSVFEVNQEKDKPIPKISNFMITLCLLITVEKKLYKRWMV